jgi:hypothetical protein
VVKQAGGCHAGTHLAADTPSPLFLDLADLGWSSRPGGVTPERSWLLALPAPCVSVGLGVFGLVRTSFTALYPIHGRCEFCSQAETWPFFFYSDASTGALQIFTCKSFKHGTSQRFHGNLLTFCLQIFEQSFTTAMLPMRTNQCRVYLLLTPQRRGDSQGPAGSCRGAHF